MEALAAAGDVGGRGAIFKQMAEMKKKIQLVEGERKAVYEDCEKEKEDNKEKIKKLGEEVKAVKQELQRSGKGSETILRHVQDRPHLDTLVLRNMSSDRAVLTIDHKVADLKKQLNKLRYDTQRKTQRIESLMKEYEKVVLKNAESEASEDMMEESAEGQRLRFLENEIHKTNLKLMEGETIKKKYSSILDMLKKERLSFTNQLEALELQIKKQDDEIVRLKKTQKAALHTREMARLNQQKEELLVIGEGKDRDRKMAECRRVAEERKNYFETMERHMFSSKQSARTGPESVATSEPAKSNVTGGTDEEGDETREDKEEANDMYEEAFSRMKKAAGVSDVEEVVHRFETQEETGKHLQELQNRAEKETRDLGAVKEKLDAEWAVVKFMGQEENTELREKLEDLEEQITDQEIRKTTADEKLQLLNKLLVGIKSGLEGLSGKLFLGDNVPVPQTRNSMEVMVVCQDKLSGIMGRIGGSNILGKKLEMEEAEFEPVGLGVASGEGFIEEDQKKKDEIESGPEEEEIPTRGYLKRQSNLIVDAKSRSKKGGRRR